jgi:hypothetical protein
MCFILTLYVRVYVSRESAVIVTISRMRPMLVAQEDCLFRGVGTQFFNVIKLKQLTRLTLPLLKRPLICIDTSDAAGHAVSGKVRTLWLQTETTGEV